MNLKNYLCSRIGGYHRRKVVARDWYSNGDPLTIKGKLEMVQQSEYDLTNVEVDFKGLIENSGYHVHIVSFVLIGSTVDQVLFTTFLILGSRRRRLTVSM